MKRIGKERCEEMASTPYGKFRYKVEIDGLEAGGFSEASGFDASILHDDDGRKYIVSLEWETREGYEKPGSICMVEYSPRIRKSSATPGISGAAAQTGDALKRPI